MAICPLSATLPYCAGSVVGYSGNSCFGCLGPYLGSLSCLSWFACTLRSCNATKRQFSFTINMLDCFNGFVNFKILQQKGMSRRFWLCFTKWIYNEWVTIDLRDTCHPNNVHFESSCSLHTHQLSRCETRDSSPKAPLSSPPAGARIPSKKQHT